MLSYLDFTEERLELGYDFGAVGGRSFNTSIIANGANQEQRNILWWQALGRWQLGERFLLDSDVTGIKEVEYLRAFHSGTKGGLTGFRFKDWSDYQVAGEVLTPHDGVTYQLTKTYQVGTQTYVRPITKPILNSLLVYVEGSVISGWSLDETTGILNLNIDPGGAVVTADFEFDVPVQFESDRISWDLEAVRLDSGETLHRLGSVFVKEMRIPLSLPYLHFNPIPQLLENAYDLGIILQTAEKIEFVNSAEELESGYRSIKNESSSITTIQINEVVFNLAQLNRLLDYFYVTRGRGIGFFINLNLKFYFVRFNSDSLSIKYEATDKASKDNLFKISNLDFYVLTALSSLDSDTYIYFFSSANAGNSFFAQNAIDTAKKNFKELAKNAIYNGDQDLADQYIILDTKFKNNWLDFPDLRVDPVNEAHKHLYIYLFDNSGPDYHGYSVIPQSEPTTTYQTDLANFLATYSEREYFRAVIYAVSPDTTSPPVLDFYDYFKTHLTNAHTGNAGYTPALNQYNIEIKLDSDPYAPAQVYLNLALQNPAISLDIDDGTYIQTLIDNSASITTFDRAEITKAIDKIRQALNQTVYFDDAKANKYVKPPLLLYQEERWLGWLNIDPRDDLGEPLKVVYLIWCNESVPAYHESLSGTPQVNEPTAEYLADYNFLVANYPNYQYFKAVLYGIDNTDQPNIGQGTSYPLFKIHAQNAFNGTNGYPAGLNQYNFDLKLDVKSNTKADFYVEDILGINPDQIK